MSEVRSLQCDRKAVPIFVPEVYFSFSTDHPPGLKIGLQPVDGVGMDINGGRTAPPAYFLTCKPPKGSFSSYDEAVRCSLNGQLYLDTWQVKGQNLRNGDRIYVLRQGTEVAPGFPPIGIVARGRCTSDPYSSKFNRDATGERTYRVNVALDHVLGHDENPLPDPYLNKQHYGGPRFSGWLINDAAIAESIESDFESRSRPAARPTEGDTLLTKERERISANILARRGQPEFRKLLIGAYASKCAVTGCDAIEALEAAHVIPYAEGGKDEVVNGLLLRSDIHTLFDLDLFSVDPVSRRLTVDARLRGGYYGWLHDKVLMESQVSVALRVGASHLKWRAANKAARSE